MQGDVTHLDAKLLELSIPGTVAMKGHPVQTNKALAQHPQAKFTVLIQ